MTNENDLNWLSGGGECGKIIRSMDWSTTSLGPVESWPQSLKTSVSLCLSSTFPINIVWGPDHVQIYNDAYRPICGALHPGSMGTKFKELWASALPVVGGAFDRGLQGEGTYIENQQMMLDRYGYLEEAFMTFSFGPIRDESGEVGGIFHPITESTEKMLSSRRALIIRDLAFSVGKSKSHSDIYDLSIAHYPHMELDLPFLLFYSVDEHSGEITLEKSVGIKGCENLEHINWNFLEVSDLVNPLRITDISDKFGDFSSGPYEENPKDAMILPISNPGSTKPTMFIVAGVSARRMLDSDYLSFYEMLQSMYSGIVGNIWAYEEEQKKAEALAQIDRAKTAFFSNVSHEFRTPLTLILGPLEDSLKDQANPLNDIQRERQEIISRNATRLLKLVNSLLDFSRAEAGRVQASFTPVDLSKFTEDLASLFRSTIEKADLKFNIECDRLPENIFIDKELWEKIILNLISNAFKFTFQGSIDVMVKWTGNAAELIVRDSGTGIPENELPKLFERFHRVQGAKSRTYEGSGIGLALVYELVKMHGGHIDVTSTVGVGTEFKITIPAGSSHLPSDRIEAVTTNTSTAISANAYLHEAQMWLAGSKTQSEESIAEHVVIADNRHVVLLVDDNADMRRYVESILQEKWVVLSATNGQEAYDLALKEHPDLILTDVMMPILDGFGLLEKIRSNTLLKSTPVVLLSARAGEEAKVEGLNAGADDYLVKPFSAKELITRVDALLKMNQLRYDAVNELKASAKKFDSMFSHALVNICMLGLDGTILETNDAFVENTGFDKNEIIGHHISELTHADDLKSNLEYLRQLKDGELEACSFEKKYLKKNGGYLWVQVSASIIYGEDGQPLYVIAISQDIESIKMAQFNYAKAVSELEEQKDLREKFVATLTHDLRSPLTAAKFSAQIIQRKPERAEVAQSHAARIVQNINRIDQMVQDLLDANRIKAGEKLPVAIDACEMTYIFEDSLENLTTIHGDRFIFKSPNTKIEGFWAADAIRRILENLCNNAIKYGDAHGPVTITLVQDNNKVFFDVHNEGNPISIVDQLHIFEPYKRTYSADAGKQRGWGLGLTLVKGMVNAHGGELKVESSPEKGTIFSVILPVDSRQED